MNSNFIAYPLEVFFKVIIVCNKNASIVNKKVNGWLSALQLSVHLYELLPLVSSDKIEMLIFERTLVPVYIWIILKRTSVTVLVIYYVEKLRLGIKVCKNLWVLHAHPSIIDGHINTFVNNISCTLLQRVRFEISHFKCELAFNFNTVKMPAACV